MTCIHGLEEINCPTCHKIRSSMPPKGLRLKNANFPNANELSSNKKFNLNESLIEEIQIKNKNLLNPPINPILKPKFINEIPNLRDQILFERINDLDILKEDKYGITKKIPLENPEWKFEEEE